MTALSQQVISPGEVEDEIYTYERMVAEMPETNLPCELWDGKIVMAPSPFPLHQYIASEFYDRLKAYVRDRKLGTVLLSPCDLQLTPHLVLQPDVLYVAKPPGPFLKKLPLTEPAELVMEVISLESRKRDRLDKRDRYEHHGIKEYWMIDPDSQTVEVLALTEGQYQLFVRARMGEKAGSKLLTGFEVHVADLLPALEITKD